MPAATHVSPWRSFSLCRTALNWLTSSFSWHQVSLPPTQARLYFCESFGYPPFECAPNYQDDITDIFVDDFFWVFLRGEGWVSYYEFISFSNLIIFMFPCEKQFRRTWYRKIFVLLNNTAAAVGGGSVQSGSPLHLLLEVTSTRISFERAWLGSVLHCCCTAPPAFGQQEEDSCRELVLPQRSWSTMVRMFKAILVALVTIFAMAEAGRIRRDTDECDKITVAHKECVKTWVWSS